jgi:hypothetical protein
LIAAGSAATSATTMTVTDGNASIVTSVTVT